MSPPPSVVVGVDGGPASTAAAREGAAQARRRLLPLHLVAGAPSILTVIPSGGAGGITAALEVGARALQQRLAVLQDELTVACPALRVTAEYTTGSAEQVLARRAGPEGRIVVGGSSTGSRPTLGRVAGRLVRDAPCPVLVHRAGGDPTGPVVVGVDCRPGTAELIGAAVDEACVRGSSLVVLHAWRVHGTGPSSAAPPEHSVAQAEADLLERLVADVRTGHPAVPVELVLRPGTAADRLLEAAESAAVLVLGRHGLRPRVPARRTSGWVLDRVGCPVLVVPVGADVRRPRGVVRARTSAR